MRTEADYQALITSWNSQKPRFVATIGAVVESFADLQTAAYSMPPAYDLDLAVGDQLDVLGLWIGFSRAVTVPLPNIYFSYDTLNLGFEQGTWLGPFDPTTGLQYLDDTTYRLMLRIKIEGNNWDGLIASADAAYNALFAPYAGVLAFVKDNEDMTMTVAISGNLPPAIIFALFLGGYFPFIPMAVGVNYYVTSVAGSACFGFDATNTYVGGFDTGVWALSEGQ
jgi:Protein of unknown function (DUF2612)